MSNFRRRLMMSIETKTAAEKAYENPTEYYGKSITNYSANGVEDWKIFYSDGSNVYIITSGYVDPAKLPSKDGAKPANTDSSYPKAATFNNILGKYSGAANITDEKMKAFNSDYFDNNYTSTNNNMKAVAYMLDKEIWSTLYADSSVAEYAVGGPSVEMTLKSYSEKKNVDYRAKAVSATGYQISNDAGKEGTWANFYSGMLKTNETLYVLPQSSGANAMWLASPSAYGGNIVIGVGYSGAVYSYSYGNASLGFRPLVCLNSNIQLEAYEGGYKIS